MAFEPGSRFEYTNGVSHLLSAIVTDATGMSSLEYARRELFQPLGITDVDWPTDVLGHNWGYANLRLTPHDMAKIGLLFLHEGQWENSQIVSTDWVGEATRRHQTGTMVDGYGYQWWVDDSGYYMALGYMGQFIFVVPGRDIVAVTTGSSEETFNLNLSLIETYILAAVTD